MTQLWDQLIAKVFDEGAFHTGNFSHFSYLRHTR